MRTSTSPPAVDYQLIVEHGQNIVDTRHALHGLVAPHLVRLGAPVALES
jgi:hypothetical protein